MERTNIRYNDSFMKTLGSLHSGYAHPHFLKFLQTNFFDFTKQQLKDDKDATISKAELSTVQRNIDAEIHNMYSINHKIVTGKEKKYQLLIDSCQTYFDLLKKHIDDTGNNNLQEIRDLAFALIEPSFDKNNYADRVFDETYLEFFCPDRTARELLTPKAVWKLVTEYTYLLHLANYNFELYQKNNDPKYLTKAINRLRELEVLHEIDVNQSYHPDLYTALAKAQKTVKDNIKKYIKIGDLDTKGTPPTREKTVTSGIGTECERHKRDERPKNSAASKITGFFINNWIRRTATSKNLDSAGHGVGGV